MVLGCLRVTLKSHHMVTEAYCSFSPVSGGWNQNTCFYTCWHRSAVCDATQYALEVYRPLRRFHQVSAEVIHLSVVSPVRCSSIYTHFLFLSCNDSCRDGAAANNKKRKEISRDTAGLEEDIFSVSLLLLEMVMQQLLELNQDQMQ